MARIDSERAAMFGGSGKEGGSNQLWVIDLDDNVSVCLLLIVTCAVYYVDSTYQNHVAHSKNSLMIQYTQLPCY